MGRGGEATAWRRDEEEVEQAAAPAVGRTPCQPLRRQRRGRRQQNVKA